MIRSVWKSPSAEEKVLAALRESDRPLLLADLLAAIVHLFPDRATREFFLSKGRRPGIHASKRFAHLLARMLRAGTVQEHGAATRRLYRLPR